MFPNLYPHQEIGISPSSTAFEVVAMKLLVVVPSPIFKLKDLYAAMSAAVPLKDARHIYG